MVWFVTGLILGGAYGWLWTWMILTAGDDIGDEAAQDELRARARRPGR